MAINDIQRNLGPSASQSHTSEAIGHAEDFSKIIVNIDPDKTYYVIVDSYTSTYRYNNLTEIYRYEENFFLRDMFAQYVRDGGLAES